MTKGRGKNNNYNGGRGGYGQSGGGYNTRSTMDINQLAANDPFADLLGTSAVASAALPSVFGGGNKDGMCTVSMKVSQRDNLALLIRDARDKKEKAAKTAMATELMDMFEKRGYVQKADNKKEEAPPADKPPSPQKKRSKKAPPPEEDEESDAEEEEEEEGDDEPRQSRAAARRKKLRLKHKATFEDSKKEAAHAKAQLEYIKQHGPRVLKGQDGTANSDVEDTPSKNSEAALAKLLKKAEEHANKSTPTREAELAVARAKAEDEDAKPVSAPKGKKKPPVKKVKFGGEGDDEEDEMDKPLTQRSLIDALTKVGVKFPGSEDFPEPESEDLSSESEPEKPMALALYDPKKAKRGEEADLLSTVKPKKFSTKKAAAAAAVADKEKPFMVLDSVLAKLKKPDRAPRPGKNFRDDVKNLHAKIVARFKKVSGYMAAMEGLVVDKHCFKLKVTDLEEVLFQIIWLCKHQKVVLPAGILN